MKKAFKAVWHGIKRAYSTVDGWLNKLFEVKPEETTENQEEKEAEKQKERAKYFRGLRLVAGTGLTVIVAFWAIVFVIWSVEGVSEWVDDMVETDKEMFEYAYLEETLSDNLFYFGRNYSSRGFLADSNDKIILKDVVWIAKPMEGDSLVCFSDGSNRGYFHIRDGCVVVEPKYSHAWIFSDGLAAVEEKGRLKFINSEGQIVIDQNLTCDFSGSGYVFHNGHCAVNDSTGNYAGLIDRNGNWVMPPVYNSIIPQDTFWMVTMDRQQAILSFDMDTIIPMIPATLQIDDTSILATFSDHTQSIYNLHGELVAASLIRDVEQMFYDTREVMYGVRISSVDDSYYNDYSSPETKKAIATCKRYEAESGWYGLMSPDGQLLTPPSYICINAIDKDLYLCLISYGNGVILNNHGKRVE